MPDTGPNVSQLAPEIDLLDGNGERWMLSRARGKVVALFFYLGDESPVCTKQMCSVRDNWRTPTTSSVLRRRRIYRYLRYRHKKIGRLRHPLNRMRSFRPVKLEQY